MKIKATQIDNTIRNTIALAVDDYASSIRRVDKECSDKYLQVAARIKHGELILCEYQYNEQEKGGDHED